MNQPISVECITRSFDCSLSYQADLPRHPQLWNRVEIMKVSYSSTAITTQIWYKDQLCSDFSHPPLDKSTSLKSERIQAVSGTTSLNIFRQRDSSHYFGAHRHRDRKSSSMNMAVTLVDISPEILHNLLAFVDVPDLARLSMSCHFLRDFIARDELLWRKLYLGLFVSLCSCCFAAWMNVSAQRFYVRCWWLARNDSWLTFIIYRMNRRSVQNLGQNLYKTSYECKKSCKVTTMK